MDCEFGPWSWTAFGSRILFPDLMHEERQSWLTGITEQSAYVMYLFGIWNSALCNHLVLLWGDVLFGRLGLTLVEFWPLTRLSNSAGEPRFGLALLLRGQLPWNAKSL
jgi:hypothetical protein